jgi:hypothetical protein
MKRYLHSKLFRALAVLVIAALAGTWAVGAVKDMYKVAKMTEKMKTVCVGRLLIDLPEDAQVELSRPWIDGFDIAAFDEGEAEFRARVAAREAAIHATPDRLGGNKNMESVKEVRTGSGLVGKIFVHGRVVTEGDAYTALGEEHYRYENVAVEGLVHANGISIDLSTEKYDPDLVNNLSKLIAQLVPNPANSVPTEAGFCIDRAYFRDPLTAKQGERVMMFAGLPSHPDIAIKFDSMAGTKPASRGLLERNARSHARAPLAASLRFTKLRASPRTIGGLTGDELVERVVEENFAIIYGFRWEVNGTKDNVFVPHLSLVMATGRSKNGPIPSSLSQPAAVSLWDKISSSIHLRPTAPPKVSAAEPEALPLGSHAWAGDTCPQSGWWQCGDGGNGIGVLGGQRQYIKQGERMPQALLLPPQTLWDKLKGVQSSFETKTPTSWKLVDKRSCFRVAPAVPLGQATVVASSTGSAAASPAAVEHRVPIGSFATTGHPCPASGWWRCEESEALDGVRWFSQGSLLPSATFSISPTVFGKHGGAPKVIQRRGKWRLMRLATEIESTGSNHG